MSHLVKLPKLLFSSAGVFKTCGAIVGHFLLDMAASYNEQAFRTFENALTYTVCAEIVHTLVDDSNATSLVVLVMVFAMLIKLSGSGRNVFLQRVTVLQQQNATAQHIVALATFLWQALHNVLVQFTSTLIARIAIKVLPPHNGNATWILGLTLMSLTLLWLLNESIKTPN